MAGGSRCIATKQWRGGKPGMHDLLRHHNHSPNQKADTICTEIVKLHSNSGVSLSSLIGWCRDGCSATLKTSRLISETANGQLYTIHCSMHRIDLCVSSDCYRNGKFCARIEKCLRFIHQVFSRSFVKIKELLTLKSQFMPSNLN